MAQQLSVSSAEAPQSNSETQHAKYPASLLSLPHLHPSLHLPVQRSLHQVSSSYLSFSEELSASQVWQGSRLHYPHHHRHPRRPQQQQQMMKVWVYSVEVLMAVEESELKTPIQ